MLWFSPPLEFKRIHLLYSYILATLLFSQEKNTAEISDHQQSWGYEDGPWKGPEPPLLVAADF